MTFILQYCVWLISQQYCRINVILRQPFCFSNCICKMFAVNGMEDYVCPIG